MKKSQYLFLILLSVVFVLIAGCTSQATPSQATPQPVTTEVTVLAPVPTTQAVTTQATTAAIITPTTAAHDPIEHRYIRQYTDPKLSTWVGYEYRFYPGGTLQYRYGTTKMVSSNVMIDSIMQEGSGTWTALGNNKYLLKYLPTGVDGAQVIEEYTLVPAHTDPAYPGVVIKEHIESEYETKQINKGQQQRADYMYYPERAKVD